MIETTRICQSCKEPIVLEHGHVLFYKNKYYHQKCFIDDRLGKKKEKSTKDVWTEDELNKFVIEQDDKHKQKIADIITKNHLYHWIQYSYGIVVLPKFFFEKMEQIFNGTWKGMSQGIPPEDIFDMWKRKKQSLDQIAANNRAKGKTFDDVGRLNYDVAVVINKYGSYCEWKEQQRKQQMETENSMSSIQFKSVDKAVSENIKKENDISDILEEI